MYAVTLLSYDVPPKFGGAMTPKFRIAKHKLQNKSIEWRRNVDSDGQDSEDTFENTFENTCSELEREGTATNKYPLSPRWVFRPLRLDALLSRALTVLQYSQPDSGFQWSVGLPPRMMASFNRAIEGRGSVPISRRLCCLKVMSQISRGSYVLVSLYFGEGGDTSSIPSAASSTRRATPQILIVFPPGELILFTGILYWFFEPGSGSAGKRLTEVPTIIPTSICQVPASHRETKRGLVARLGHFEDAWLTTEEVKVRYLPLIKQMLNDVE
ncbi:hypothetical protein EI94DRAFT_1701948 [Lactarius quietus]|nr:hypothetical protein EI94DRAFT_1701948 [Lactarius quietus]